MPDLRAKTADVENAGRKTKAEELGLVALLMMLDGCLTEKPQSKTRFPCLKGNLERLSFDDLHVRQSQKKRLPLKPMRHLRLSAYPQSRIA